MADLWDTPASSGPGAFAHLGTEEEVQELLDAHRAAQLLEQMSGRKHTDDQIVCEAFRLAYPNHDLTTAEHWLGDHSIHAQMNDAYTVHCGCGQRLTITGEQYVAARFVLDG